MSTFRIMLVVVIFLWATTAGVAIRAAGDGDWELVLWVLVAASWGGIALMWCKASETWKSVAGKHQANAIDAESWWPDVIGRTPDDPS